MSNHLGTKRLSLEYRGQTFSVRLFDGAEPWALAQAVAARLGLHDQNFFLTLPGDDDLVPLSAALPDGLTLALHTQSMVVDTSPAAHTGYMESARSKPTPPLSGFPGGIAPSPTTGFSTGPSQGTMPSASIAQSDCQGNLVERPNEASVHASCHTTGVQESFLASHIGQERMEEAVESIDRFSRLSTDLANERTLLAWIRTGLAAMRTTFSFYSLWALALHQVDVLWTCQMAMALTVVAAGVCGWSRYATIKKATLMPVPPTDFGRTSIRYFAFLVIIVSSVVLLSVGSKGLHSVFEHNAPTPAPKALI